MAGEEHTRPDRGTLTEEQAARMLADMNDVIRAGEETRRLRAELVKVFAGFGWTQDRIARLTGMSQPAVSKQVAKDRAGDPPPVVELSLGQHDAPWLEGRLWGLAEEVSEAFYESAGCTRFLHAVARGKKRFTPQGVDELRRLVEADLRRHRAELPGGYQEAYDQVARGLDFPVRARTTATEPAAVRRALARQIQRDRLRGLGR